MDDAKVAARPSKSSTITSIRDACRMSSAYVGQIDWMGVLFLVVLPAYAMVQAFHTPLRLPTFIWALFYYILTGTAITAGYHRLWAHTSYSATFPLRLFLALAGAGAFQHSIRWWARNHRAHHRYTDTAKDPYSVNRSFMYAHMGWLIFKQHKKGVGRVDVYDLDQDKIVIWQHRNLLVLQLVMGLVLPISVAGYFWNDWWGGFVYAGVLRFFLVHQATFAVNSLAHTLGEQTFDDRHSPRDHSITAFVTFGEGYHNFHHAFPSDYRNALEWYQYDPTKWLIWLWKQMGLAHDLKTFRMTEIEKRRLQQSQKALQEMQKDLQTRYDTFDWGVALETLPVLEWDEYVRSAREPGQMLVAIAGVVHNIAGFVDEHPGGKTLLMSAVGKDATAMFNGGVYQHSLTARNILATMRVGMLHGGGEVEIWKESSNFTE